MKSSKYLPIGSNIGDHYEIIDVLGDDDFEILYLVRDTNRKGSFFVLKELFLETFSSRKLKSVSTIPEAQGVFDKRKREIILELSRPNNSNNARDEVKTYGYIEDNNTIYTIMEFTNNFELEKYLHFEPRDEIILPPLDTKMGKKGKNSFLFLKILILAMIVVAGLGYYTYTMIKKDREKTTTTPQVVVTQTPVIHHPSLVSRDKSSKEEPKVEDKDVKSEVKKSATLINHAEYIPDDELEEIPTTDIKESAKKSNPFTKNDSIYIDNETEEIPVKREDNLNNIPKVQTITPPTKEVESVAVSEVKRVPQTLPPITTANHISLGTKIGDTSKQNNIALGTPIQKESKDIFNRVAIKHFLDGFIASSATGSIEDIASKYDYAVDRYFSLRNVTQTTIKRDKKRYNRKWTHRNFTITYFKILKKYRRDGTDYCDLKTTTKWRVSTNYGKRASGKSRGFMTLKNTPNGFKVKSIYTIK